MRHVRRAAGGRAAVDRDHLDRACGGWGRGGVGSVQVRVMRRRERSRKRLSAGARRSRWRPRQPFLCSPKNVSWPCVHTAADSPSARSSSAWRRIGVWRFASAAGEAAGNASSAARARRHLGRCDVPGGEVTFCICCSRCRRSALSHGPKPPDAHAQNHQRAAGWIPLSGRCCPHLGIMSELLVINYRLISTGNTNRPS